MSNTYNRDTGKFTDPKTWNDNFETLLKIRWAIWLLSVKLGLLKYDELTTFTEGRYIDDSEHLGVNVRTENHQTCIILPGKTPLNSEMLGKFWRVKIDKPCIGAVYLSLLEIPLLLDQIERKSNGPVLEITNLSKQYFGKHDSPTDYYWNTKTWNEHENYGELIPGDADSQYSRPESEERETSALAELANLKAPNEQWDANLGKVDSIVVSLIQTPVQDYTDLVKDISSDDLESYAKQGLTLWCKNTNKGYDETTRSIKNANTWNANYGLLVKIRWAVWLLLIKEEKVKPEDLQSCVKTRHFAGGSFPDIDKNLEWWYEDTDLEVPLTTLTTPPTRCYLLSPYIGPKVGNVVFVIWSLTGDLPLESPQSKYNELSKAMEEIATDALPNCMYYIQKD